MNANDASDLAAKRFGPPSKKKVSDNTRNVNVANATNSHVSAINDEYRKKRRRKHDDDVHDDDVHDDDDVHHHDDVNQLSTVISISSDDEVTPEVPLRYNYSEKEVKIELTSFSL